MTPKKRAPKKPAKRTARRQRIAEGVVAGKTQGQIAQEEGVSRGWIQQEAAADETKQIISRLVNAHLPAIERLFEGTLIAIAEAFEAEVSQVVSVTTITDLPDKGGKQTIKTSEVLSLGRDHYARLAAAKRFIELVTAGRATPKAPEANPGDQKPTWSQFLQLIENSKARTGEQ